MLTDCRHVVCVGRCQSCQQKVCRMIMHCWMNAVMLQQSAPIHGIQSCLFFVCSVLLSSTQRTYVLLLICLFLYNFFISPCTFSALTLLVGRQEGHPAYKKTWAVGYWHGICLERGADLHTAQRMPLPLTVSCFSKIQIGFTFLVPAHLGSPGQRAVKWLCVCYWPLVLRTGECTAHEYFTNSWVMGFGVILISRAWIRRLVPLFLGEMGKLP